MRQPGQDTLKAFNVHGHPVLLPGGEGRTYRVAEVVLKYVGTDDVDDVRWMADLFHRIQGTGFSVSRPLPTIHGAWISDDGWTAWTYVEGHHRYAKHIPESVEAIRAFHHALSGIPKPDFLSREVDNPYRRADAFAWNSQPDHLHPDLKRDVELLYSLRTPLADGEDQLIHGDLNPGNILLSPAHEPAIIDLAPYWRPPEFASAIYAYWIGPWREDIDVLDHFSNIPNFTQMLVRAAIRMLLIMSEFDLVHDLEQYHRATAITRAFVHRSGTPTTRG
ncbi:MAG TPA: aminoglycoside phosphotransferase family protein [Herpetosiphonaceae bacterium]|jgi:uncharacterized protein (TIGR02569 family)|nr:aminoglycoside phosphotransferase family protein [Herpetosiphonaceae bacterium]